MTSTPHFQAPAATSRFNTVPEVAACFWAIKIMATTVGETGADYLISRIGLGLSLTSILRSLVLAVVLGLQFRTDRYRPCALRTRSAHQRRTSAATSSVGPLTRCTN